MKALPAALAALGVRSPSIEDLFKQLEEELKRV